MDTMWPTLMSCSFLLSCTGDPRDTGEFTLLPSDEVQFFEGDSSMMTPQGGVHGPVDSFVVETGSVSR